MKLPMSRNSRVLARLRTITPGFYRESVVKNAVYLQASNIVMSVMGFVFWTLAAREFPKSEVGIATVILTSASLISSIGVLGLDSSLVRFLPTSEEPQEHFAATLSLTLAASLVAGVGYLALAPTLSHQLRLLADDWTHAIGFLGFTSTIVACAVLQSTFIAKRRALMVIISNSLFSVLKICILPLLIALGTFGIVMAGWGALLVSLVFGAVAVRKLFGLRFQLTRHFSALRRVRAYASSLFAGGMISSIVVAAIPIIVLDRLGAAAAADYYIVLSLATILHILASTTGQSLLAEGSHSQRLLHSTFRRASIHIFSILVPLALIYILFGHYLLLIFGQSYAAQGTGLLRILAAASPLVALNYLGNTLANIRRMNKLFVAISSFNALLIILFSFLLVGQGLDGLGLAWLMAQAATVMAYAVVFRHELGAFVRGDDATSHTTT